MSDFFTLGLLGHPLTHSLSPRLHAAALRYAGLKGQYLLFDIAPDDFEDSFTKMLRQAVNGFNVTIPYKKKVWEKMHELTPEARQAGAVNTVKVTPEGKLLGHNTDVGGFKFALTELMNLQGTDLHGKAGLVIGAGGAARAAIVALSQLGLAVIKIRGRSHAKADTLVTELTENLAATPEIGSATYPKGGTQLILDDGEGCEQLSIIVNASPIGLLDDTCPEWLPILVSKLSNTNECLCFDMVYHKDKTSPIFTKLAQQRSLPAVDGLPMLIHQARFAFEYWTGVNVPYEIMYGAL